MVIFIPSLFSFHILSVYLPSTPIKGYTMKDINRIKVVLVEQKKTGKWLAEQLGKDPSTVSKWCSNKMQPSLEMLMQIAEKLDVDVRNLIVTTKQ
jgi:putative transcriptional regulator